jgi:plasmid stability protein
MATLTIDIPDRTEERLRCQAQAVGKPVEQWVREVLVAQARSAEIGTEMSEEELAETLEREDHAARGVPYGD